MVSHNNGLPTAQRNPSGGHSVLDALSVSDSAQPHPGETLFDLETIKDLVVKGAIPQHMGMLIARLLWTAERYSIPARESMVAWYLRVQLGVDARARDDYKQVVMNFRKKEDEEGP